RSLRLKSGAAWRKYCGSRMKPEEIPAAPWNTYAKDWNGMGDWLGTGVLQTQVRPYLSFVSARAFVRRLGLKDEHEWRTYSKSARKPNNIPAAPSAVYAGSGWNGMRDWLGTHWW